MRRPQMLRTIVVEYPETIPAVTNQSPEDFEAEAKRAMAVKLFELGRLSSGQAAQLAGIGRVEFLLTCKQMGVSTVEWDDKEIESEFH
jgi:predicted HTH domain antitoxin